MVGKNCLSPKQILLDISIDNIKISPSSIWNNVFSQAEQLTYIYGQSKIDIQHYHKTCVLISYKTSNNQDNVDSMPFYMFNNFITFLNEIVEEENKNESGGETGKDMMDNASGMMKQNISSASTSFKNNMKFNK